MIGSSDKLRSAVSEIVDTEEQMKHALETGADVFALQSRIREVKTRLLAVEEIYKIPATEEDLAKLGKITQSGFILGVGLDRAQAIAIAPDRTVMALTARAILSEEVSFYFILDIFIPKTPTMPVLAERIINWAQEFGYLDKIVIESYQGQDLWTWCQDRGFEAELAAASYKNQLEIFTNLCVAATYGLLKCPPVPYYTDEDGNLHSGFSRQKEDIFREELSVFAHDADKKWFGAPDKRKRGGIKDDVIYATAWSLYATQGEAGLGTERQKRGDATEDFAGTMINRDVLGEY